MDIDQRIDVCTNLAGGDMRKAFAAFIRERDDLYRRATAAEKSLGEIRAFHEKQRVEWIAAATKES